MKIGNEPPLNIWSFLGMAPASEEKLADVSKSSVVDESGIYVLFTSDGRAYRYPKGESPIFYIGMSEHLCDRVYTHQSRVKAIESGCTTDIEWPRYEYAAAHGCKIAAFVLAAGCDCRNLEADAIALFAKMYGAPPIANGAASRNKVLRRKPSIPPRGLTVEPWLVPKMPNKL